MRSNLGLGQPRTVYIYQLVTEHRAVFYIGRTIHPEQREREHRYMAGRNSPELKYRFIRDLKAIGDTWTLEVIDNCSGEIDKRRDATENLEDWYIYQALVNKHPLTNERKGSVFTEAENSMMNKRRLFRTVDDFVEAREKERKALTLSSYTKPTPRRAIELDWDIEQRTSSELGSKQPPKRVSLGLARIRAKSN